MKEKRSHDLCLVGFLSSVLCSVSNLELFCLCEFSLSILISILRYIHRPAAPPDGTWIYVQIYFQNNSTAPADDITYKNKMFKKVREKHRKDDEFILWK